ncbi:MAG: hypothetical protein IJ306_05015 [Oscillospiraceae bacterium]|nr:hypothetical protein [Oscillospiraceae bacterium]
MKKFISLILAVMMVLSCSVVSMAEETAPAFKFVSEPFTEEGQEQTVKLVAENVGGITMLQFTIEYDAEKLELVSCTAADSIAANTLVNAEKAGRIIVVYDSTVAAVIEDAVVTMVFKAVSDELGETVIGFNDEEDFIVCDDKFSEIVFEEENKADHEVEIDYVHEHEWGDWKVTAEPGCTTGGQETRYCICYNGTCDEFETRETEAAGHTPGEAVVENEVAPSCETEGSYDTVVYCAVCKEELSRETTTVPATGHTWGDWVVTKEGSCEEYGEETRTCAICGETETRATEQLGHKFGEWVVTKEATCEEAGEETSTCSACGDVVTREIPALGHSYNEGVVTTEPTCEGKGVKTYTCATCGGTYTEEVPALGHTPGEAVVENEVAPSCETDGSYDTVVYCTVCEEEISREITTVPALGHSYDEGVVTTEPTCEGKGVKTYTCATCGGTKTEDVPELGHDYQYEIVKEPGCEEEGERKVTCSRCDYEKIEAIEALGHEWGAWKVVKQPSYTEEGLSQRVCEKCGEIETKAIPKLVDKDYVNPGVTVITPGNKNDGEANPNTGAASAIGVAVLVAVCGAAAVVSGKKNK